MTCEYIMDNGACVPRRVHTVVVSVQHSEKVTLDELRLNVLEKVIKKVIPAKYLDDKTIFHVNPCGDFVIGGPQVKKFFLFLQREIKISYRSMMSFFMYLLLLSAMMLTTILRTIFLN